LLDHCNKSKVLSRQGEAARVEVPGRPGTAVWVPGHGHAWPAVPPR